MSSILMPENQVPFSLATHVAGEGEAVQAVLASGATCGGTENTLAAQEALKELTGSPKVLLTSSGTAALELACLLVELKQGDEVILPSFTFSSCANSIALRGAIPVFVDIRPDTLNIDEQAISQAITPATKAIMPVHYSGVAAEMNSVMAIAQEKGLTVIEDAAQGIGASYEGHALGAIGAFGAISFHGTKNISCGEGGALLINDEQYFERAEVLWEKGTNRRRFMEGLTDKYTWVDIGSSFLPSEITAALLRVQLENVSKITRKRLDIWNRYHIALQELEEEGLLRRPVIPSGCEGNGHIYGVIMNSGDLRDQALKQLRRDGVTATFHYVPLHSSPAGRKLGRIAGTMEVTDKMASRLLRLPLFSSITPEQQDTVIERLKNFCRSQNRHW
jgi:dTDP-4-amino-4,6-dideoxygalactose transaminase